MPSVAACGDESVKAVLATAANTMPATVKLLIVLNLVMGPPMSGNFPAMSALPGKAGLTTTSIPPVAASF
jgi:hypothetical protein